MDSYFCTNTGPAAVLYIPAKNNPAVRQGEGGYSAAAAAHAAAAVAYMSAASGREQLAASLVHGSLASGILCVLI